MKTLTRKDFAEWCENRGLESVGREWPYYRDANHHSFLVKLPDRSSRLLALARWCFPCSNDGRSFQGSMIWLRDWGIWSEPDEEMGMRIITQMRRALGENRQLGEAPGHIFSEQEFVDARAFWTLPMILGWDAILFPEKGDYFVFNSHDEVMCFVAREKQLYTDLLGELKDWQPEESEWYFR
jgi:hypothetical protein